MPPEGGFVPGQTLAPLRLVAPPMAVSLLAEPVAWLILASGALALPWFGRPGMLVAAHLLGLGTLAMAVVGAGWQLLAVVVDRPLAPRTLRWAPRINAVAIVGLLALVTGFRVHATLAAVGGALVVTALVARAVLVLVALARASGRVSVRAWLASAELSLLVGLAVASGLLGNRLGLGWVADHTGAIGLHASLMLGGWIGGWILGLAGLLLPMFTASPEPRGAPMMVAGAAWFGGLLVASPRLWAVGAVIAALSLLHTVARRARRDLGAGAALATLGLAGLLVAGGIALALPGEPDVVLVSVGFALFALPVLRGMAQRIAPFLAWAHTWGGDAGRAPRVDTLVSAPLAQLSLYASVVGGVAVVWGLMAQELGIARGGAGISAVAALAQLALIIETARRAVASAMRAGALPGMERR